MEVYYSVNSTTPLSYVHVYIYMYIYTPLSNSLASKRENQGNSRNIKESALCSYKIHTNNHLQEIEIEKERRRHIYIYTYIHEHTQTHHINFFYVTASMAYKYLPYRSDARYVKGSCKNTCVCTKRQTHLYTKANYLHRFAQGGKHLYTKANICLYTVYTRRQTRLHEKTNVFTLYLASDLYCTYMKNQVCNACIQCTCI